MFQTVLILATLLCGLVAGLLFGFAVVAMPGINTLNDGEFIRAFQVMDRVIQNNQPLFIVTWIGSVILVVAAVLLGVRELDGAQLGLLLVAAAVYLVGVQVPTATINIPLNNRIQQVDTVQAEDEVLAEERSAFEPRWNQWNRIRTVMAIASTTMLLIVLLRL